MLIKAEIRKTFQIIFLISIVPLTLEAVCDAKNLLEFTANSVVYRKAEEEFCFNNKDVAINRVYTEVGFIDDKEILKSITCSDTSHSCFYPPESFEAILLQDTSSQKMMVINEVSKMDYKEGNRHIKSRYLPNEIECFYVSNSRGDTAIPGLESYTNHYFTNSNENLHCLIFDSDEKAVKKIMLDSKEVTINVASEYVASLFKPGPTVPECTDYHATSVTFNDSIDILTLDAQTYCIDGRTNELDLFRDVPNNRNKRNTECYINDQGTQKSCLRVYTDVFKSGVFRSLTNSRKTLLFHPYSPVYVERIKFNQLRSQYSLNDRFCVNPDIYTSKRHLLRGYYNKKNQTHCFVAKEVAGSTQIEVQKDSDKKTITFKGCPVNITKPIITNFPILLDDDENKFCLNKDYVFIDDAYSSTDYIDVFNLQNTDNCWIDLPAKRCFSIGEDTDYMLLVNKERSVNALVSKKKATVNGQLSTDFLYQAEYGKYPLICIPKSILVNDNKLINKVYVNADSTKVCISVSLMATSTKENVEIELKNSAGCQTRKLTLNPYTYGIDIEDLEVKECNPFHRKGLGSEDVIKIFSNDLHEKCLLLTCSDVAWTLNLKSATSKTDILSTKVVMCNDKPSTKCIDFSNLDLILYKTRNNILKHNILVMTKENLPRLIVDDYQRFYLPSYGKDDVVCFIKAKIQEFVEENFRLKDSKYACAIVGELNSDVTIKFNNIADCQQEIQLLHNTVATADKESDPQSCLFLLKNETQNTFKLNDEVINRCQPLTCSEVKHIVVTSDSIIRDTQKIMDCPSPNKWNECDTKGSKLTLFKIQNKFIPNGKFMYKDVTFTLSQNFFYAPYYSITDMVCFASTKVENIDEIDENHVFSKNDNFCIFPRDTQTDITVNVKINKFCRRSIVFKATNMDSIEPDPLSSCRIFTENTKDSNMASVIKLDDVKECLTNICIEIEYVMNKKNEVLNCDDKNCYKNDWNDMTYMKLKSQYNGRTFYIMPTDIYNKLDSESTINTFYLSGYFKNEMICVPDEILEDPKKEELTKGVARLNGGKRCYFTNELDETHEFNVKLKGKFVKTLKLYTEERTNARMSDIIKDDEKCMMFVKPSQNIREARKLNLTEMQKCADLTFFEVSFGVQKPQNPTDLQRIMEKCSANEDRCHRLLKDFEYAKISSIYHSTPIYVQNSNLRDIVIPERYFHDTAYFSNEVVCVNSNLINNPTEFDYTNSYEIDTKTCIIPGASSKQKVLEIKTSGDCVRSINLNYNTARNADIKKNDIDNKCTPFSTKKKMVNVLSLSEIKQCLRQTCSKVVSAVKITNKKEKLISSKIMNCSTNDYSGSCLKDDDEYDFIEIINDYVDGPIYFRTFENQENTKDNEEQTIQIYYKPFYSSDDVVCFRKELVKDLQRFSKLNGVFKENSRICSLTNKLEADFDIKYQINPNCDLDVKLKSSFASKVPSVEVDISFCEKFIPGGSQNRDVLKMTTDELRLCLTKTCSIINQVIINTTNADGSLQKNVQSCLTASETETCLKAVDSADALEIVTPFKTSSFYVTTKDSFEVPPSATHYYQDEYYSGDVVCFEKSIITTKVSQLSDPGIIDYGNNICFVVKDLIQDIDLTIQLFNKCAKKIKMKHTTSSMSLESLNDLCTPFYTPKSGIQTITKAGLKSCLAKTCSQLNYLVKDIKTKNKLEKTIISYESEYGVHPAVAEDAKFYFAKVTNPALIVPVYFEIDDSIISLEDQLKTEHYFYQSEYGPESVVCFESSHIKNILTEKITFTFGEHTCIVILESKVTTDLSLNNPLCPRTIRLNPNKPISSSSSSSSYLQKDKDCVKFLQTPNTLTTVLTVTKDLLKKCLSHTCSKVQGLVEIGDISNPNVLHKYLNCDRIQKNDECLDSNKEYDYIKIVNPFVTSPIYFRTREIPFVNMTPRKTAIFYNSTYFDNDVVCFANDRVVIPDEQKNQNGIFVGSTQKCIITKELSSDIQVQHKITETCDINITFLRNSSPKQENIDRELEKKCSNFLNIATDSSNILNIPSADILSCIKRTCSKITKITSMASSSSSETVKTCENDVTDESCLTTAQDTDTLFISSPFISSTIQMRKSDNDSTLLSSASVPSYYESQYFADQVLCINESELVDSVTVKELKEATIVNEKVCVIVKNLDKDTRIEVKQFGKCQKSIELKFQTRKEADTSNADECSDFYSIFGASHKRMTIASLKSCIQSTCSKIEYLVPKRSDNESPIFEIQKCEDKPGEIVCIDAKNEIYFAKISNQARDGFITITTDNVESIDQLKYDNFYHNENLNKNQVMCVEKKKLIDEDSYDTTKSFETNNYKCLIGFELETNKHIKILTSTKKGCQRQINVVLDSTISKDNKKCSKFIQSNDDLTLVHSIFMSDLQLCLLKTCSKVFSAVEMISSQPLMQSKLINCETSISCLTSDKTYDFIKIKNDYLTGHIYFRTFDPSTHTSYLPISPFLYKNSFFKNDVVCFMKSKLTSKDFSSSTTGIFVEEGRTCVIVSELSTPISVNYPISDTCNHRITMNNTQEPDDYKDKSDVMKSTCSLFFVESPLKLDLPSMSKETLMKCIEYTCSKISTFISLTNAKDVYSSKKLQICSLQDTCLNNVVHFENLKIQSPYRNSNFTVSSQDATSSSSDFSKKTQYLDSYSGNDVVCLHDDLLTDSKAVQRLPSVFKKHDAYCLVASDLSPNTEVSIKQYGKCKKIIKFNPSPSIGESQSCEPLYKSANSISDSMKHDQLLKCIEDTCSKIEYFTFDEDTNGKRNRKLHKCHDDNGVADCIKNSTKYQIVKISNPSRDTPILVKLDTASASIPIISSSVVAENDQTLKTESYFYKTDYFQDDILCVPTSSVTSNSDITSFNSYTIGNETCIIIKDLSKSISLKLSSSGCSQTINLHPKDSLDRMPSANSLYNLCERLYKPSQSKIYPMSLINLRKCLAHTCSSVVGYREVQSFNPDSMIGKILSCDTVQHGQNCLSDNKFYDFVRVKSTFLSKDVQFTTLETATTESVNSHLSEYYQSNYYNDDLVCFLTNKIKRPSNLDSLEGVLVKDDKTCIVVKDLASMIDVEYQITDTCSKTISLNSGRTSNKVIDDVRADCSHFITDYTLTEILPKYSKDQLLNCISKTCSRIVSFVKSDTSSVSKKIKTCDSSESPTACLGDVLMFEALEVKSPSVVNTFYVQSEGLTQASKSIFMNTNYYDAYYNDEVVCVNKDVMKNKGSRIDKKVIYKNGDVTCFIVKESSEGDTFTVKIHSHCDKTIQLVKSHSSSARSESKLKSQCQKFYTTTNDYEKMTYNQLADCVQYTCSKVDYYVTNQPSGKSAVQRIEECTTSYGHTSCMDSENHPYLVKVTNPITNVALYIYIYIINSQRVDIDPNTLGKTFHKTEYNKNDVVCFKSTMLANTHHELAIPFPQNEIKCIVVNDLLKDEKITFTMEDGCNKEITLKKTTSEHSDEVNLEDCTEFLTNPTGKPSVSTTSIQKLISCIQVTCSKVESSLEVKTNDLISISSPLTKCEQIHGNPQCLKTMKMYDFVKLKNSFLSKPLILRTFDQKTDEVTPKDFPLFYSSVYAGDHVVCFNKTQVLNTEQLNKEWIYHESDRLCVLVSDVTSKTEVNLQIGESYSRSIIFVPKSQSDSYEHLRSNDKICQEFYSKENTIIPISLDNLKICVKLSGLTIENDEIRNIFSECSSKEDDPCKLKFKSIRIPIRSVYRKDQLLVISPETSSELENLIDDPSRYSLIYTRNDIPCFASSSIPETSKNIIKYLDVDKKTFCIKLEKEHEEEYLVKIDKNLETQVSIMDSHAILTLLQSAYSVNLDIYTFESEKKLVSKGASASFHFTVQDNEVYKTHTEFTSCVSSSDTKEPIVTSNYSSFIQGYLATIPKNNIFIHPLSVYVTKKKACIGYMENENSVDIKANKKSKKLTKSTYECLPVLNGYLLLRFNALNDNLNVTEKLDSGCLKETMIKMQCEHTHQFSDHITICYGKGKSVEKDDQRDSSNKIDETILLDIRVLLKNGDCYTEKAVLSQRVGFCEIKDGFVQMSLFSYDSFTRTMVRHEMISTSYESTFFVVFIFVTGLIISGMLMKFHKLTVEKDQSSFHPPLIIFDT